jgi:uncharacterized protein (DUF111 family)
MDEARYETDFVVELSTNLDDITAEVLAHATTLLLDAGALDVWTTAIQMKKQRQGVLLSVLCTPERKDEFADLILRHTTAFGVRMHTSARVKLRRDFTEVQTDYGPIRVKRGFIGNTLTRTAPEFDACKAAALKHSVAIQAVYDAALLAVSRLKATAVTNARDSEAVS